MDWCVRLALLFRYKSAGVQLVRACCNARLALGCPAQTATALAHPSPTLPPAAPQPLASRHPPVAAVAAGSETALASAILQALQLHPRCLEFFIDRCDRFEAPLFVREAAGKPDTLAGLGTPSSYMVCAKQLQAGSGGAAVPPLPPPHSRV